MVNYGKPVWEYVLEAAKELNLKLFTPSDIINKVREKNPNIKKNTIRCHVIGMSPNHPSSKHYPSIRRNHPAFSYLGDGQFQILSEMKEPGNKEEVRKAAVSKVNEWEKLMEKIIGLQSDIAPFKIDFIDRNKFKSFCDNLSSTVQNYEEICITGYFSETIREELQRVVQRGLRVRLICPEFAFGSKRDKKNLEALRKLAEAGAKIKFNYRLHARLMISYVIFPSGIHGELVLGSFDFNTECIGKERYDAGIRTRNPDLLVSAISFFEKVWQDSESITIEEFLKDKR